MRILFSVLAVALLTGCGSIMFGQNYEYNSQDKEALLAFSHEKLKEKGQFVLLNIDLDGGKITNVQEFGSVCPPNNLFCVSPTAVLANTTGRRYYLLKVPAGIYGMVRVSAFSFGVFPGGSAYGHRLNHYCYDQGLEVFEVTAGRVNTIDIGEMMSDLSVSDEAVAFQIKKGGISGITAEIKKAKPKAIVRLSSFDCKEVDWDNKSIELLEVF